MKNTKQFRGVGVALVTPFNSDGSIDEPSLERLVDFQIEQGTDFLVPCGTTGENPALSQDEHRRVVEIVVRCAKGRVPVLAGAGSNSTQKAIELAQLAIDLGAAFHDHNGATFVPHRRTHWRRPEVARSFNRQSHFFVFQGFSQAAVVQLEQRQGKIELRT